ncbi:MAG: FkbM family methyltransferase [Pseudomonadota bacterium]
MHHQKKQQSGRKEHPKNRKTQEKSRLFQQALERYRAGTFEEAESLIQSHIKRHPEEVEAVNLAGLIAYQCRRYDSAIQFFQSAIRLNDKDHNYLNNLGAALKDSGDLKGAIPCFQKAIDLNPDYSEASYNLGGSYQILGELDLAIDWYEYTLTRNPGFHLASTNLACINKDQGKIGKAIEGFRHVVKHCPKDALANSNLLFALSYQEEVHPETVFRHHQEWAIQHAQENSGNLTGFANDLTVNRRIRVGYVSPDFRVHSVAFFIHPVIQGHNRENVEVFCYADVPKPDEVTQVMMKTADHWQNIFQMPDDQVFQRIQKDQIDILVDLTGHSGNNRMKLFARKPAPVQVAYLGYPNTTGQPAMDYRITDAKADPPGMTDPYYTEVLIRLDGGFLCYHPSLGSPDITDAPCLKNGYITFGSFNNRAKINSKVIALWSGLLKQVDNSRLILKSSIPSDQSAKQQLLSLFVQNGVEASRIELLPYLPFSDHLKQYLRVDIALDTFPYNGTTTTCEALWMGVPVITLVGNTHASRVGVSILSQLAFDEGIAESENDYIQKAVMLASDTDFLQSWRTICRRKMQASSLMDEKGFAIKLETAYRHMWLNWCAKLIIEGVDHRDILDARICGDITVCVPNDINCLTPYILQEYQDWFEQEIAFVRTFLNPGMHVVDIGANYGTYTLTAATSIGPSGKVWAFEPSQLTAAYLTRSIRRNQLNNITVIQAGVSDSDRLAFLSMNTNSELNQVEECDVAGPKEAIALMSLDGWMEAADARIDFMKMDAEGQEDNIIRGGKRFFESCSPLILYGIKRGDAFHLEMVRSFLDIGYQSYRLIPGLNILAPFSMGEKLDAFQLNLFCCKADRAETLWQQGLLVSRKENELSLADVPASLWVDYLQEFPYVLRFLPLWQTFCDKHVGDPDWQVHQQALSAYAVSKLPNYSASDRYWALTKGYGLMKGLLQSHASISRILTATRMAIDLGYQEAALIMLNHLLSFLESSQEFSVDEPFLSVSAHMATVDPGGDMGQWLVYAVLETREICQAHSSYLTGKNSLPNLELMRTSPFYGDKMERRRQLIRTRFGIKD